jgi:hypothetical protein
MNVVDRARAAWWNRCSRRKLRSSTSQYVDVLGIASLALAGHEGTENAAVEALEIGGMICE